MVKISGISFTSKVVYVAPQNALTEAQKDYIDKFEETPDEDKPSVCQSTYLGEGVCSKAYLANSQSFVVKQNKPGHKKWRGDVGSLGYENEILHSLGDNIKTTQRGIAYAETEKGGQFLVSTYAKGKQADYATNPMTPKHVDRLLRNLYRLDKNGILHSDLSRANLLLDDESNVNIIDYQWGEKFGQKWNRSVTTVSFPDFEEPNNAVSYEGAGLASYLREIASISGTEAARSFLKNYLITKSHYVDKKIKYLENLLDAELARIDAKISEIDAKLSKANTEAREDIQRQLNLLENVRGRDAFRQRQLLQDQLSETVSADCLVMYAKDKQEKKERIGERIEFEKAKAYVYKNPTDEVLDAELLKMNILNENRRQYTCYDTGKIGPRNVLMAIPHCLGVKISADNLASFKDSAKDEQSKKYFDYMRRYGLHWQNNCQRWYPGALKNVYAIVSEYRRDSLSEQIYFPDLLEDFKGTGNLVPLTLNCNSNEKRDAAAKMLTDIFLNAHKTGYDHAGDVKSQEWQYDGWAYYHHLSPECEEYHQKTKDVNELIDTLFAIQSKENENAN